MELCAGLSALSLLLAGVVPSLRQAREDALLAECQAKLGRIMAASLVYSAADSAEQTIPIGVGDEYSQGANTASYGFGGRSGWFTTKPTNSIWQSPYAGGNLIWMGAPHRPLNAILYKSLSLPPIVGRGGTADWTFDARLDLDAYACPADTGFPGMHHRAWKDSGLSAYEHYGTSYAASTLFYTPSSAQLYSVSVYQHALSTVPAPAATLAYFENAARFAFEADNVAEFDQQGCSWPYSHGAQTAWGWHGMPFEFNVAFVDGHAAKVGIHGYGQVLPPQCAPWPGGCWCYSRRTSAWRADTIPTRIAPTNKYLQSTPSALQVVQ